MKQVEEEYYKADEKTSQVAPTGGYTTTQANSQDLYPPSPDQPLSSMSSNVPDPVKEALKSLIRSQSVPTNKDKSQNIIVIPDGSTAASLGILSSNKSLLIPVTPEAKTPEAKTPEDRTPEFKTADESV